MPCCTEVGATGAIAWPILQRLHGAIWPLPAPTCLSAQAVATAQLLWPAGTLPGGTCLLHATRAHDAPAQASPGLSLAGHTACRWLGLFKTLANHVADEEKDTLAYEVSVSEDDPTKILIYERCVVWKCTGVQAAAALGPVAGSEATSDWYCACCMIKRAAGCTFADAMLAYMAGTCHDAPVWCTGNAMLV